MLSQKFLCFSFIRTFTIKLNSIWIVCDNLISKPLVLSTNANFPNITKLKGSVDNAGNIYLKSSPFHTLQGAQHSTTLFQITGNMVVQGQIGAI